MNASETEQPSAIQEQFKKVSYAQCGEDMIMHHIFLSLGIDRPSYIDIGAHHPFYINNTAFFSLQGSVGINIEPDPDLFALFPTHRTRDTNLNIGISSEEGEADFYIISAPTLNTFSKETAISYESEGDFRIVATKKIRTLPIQAVISQYANNIFPDFLTLDAEGIDEIILRSIDFERNCPTVICIETISFSQSGNGTKNREIIDFICSKGYLHYADTYINSIFVLRSKWVR